MPQNSLQELAIEGLKDLYDAEQQITRALPQMAQAATHPELRTAFEEHLQQTQGQIQRLEQIFQQMGQQPDGTTCRAMQGLIEETQQHLSKGGDPDALDALLIACAQKVEHYEIAGYGTARTWAMHLGQNDVAEILQQTLDEEGETDKRLTRLAESHINRDANQGQDAAA